MSSSDITRVNRRCYIETVWCYTWTRVVPHRFPGVDRRSCLAAIIRQLKKRSTVVSKPLNWKKMPRSLVPDVEHLRAQFISVMLQTGKCLLALLLLGSSAHAQYRFDTWTAENGLPQNIIRDIEQTSDGYLWLATLNGLARFDGVRFTIFDK